VSELEAIKKSDLPCTREKITIDLRSLGLKEGDVVVVHSSLSSLGWVCGGAVAVVQALIDVIGKDGTIIMPSQTGDYSDPCYWESPPVPKEWWKTIKETMPAFNEKITPSLGMGKIAETFRNFPNVIRSSHPQVSFTGWGKFAKELLKNHPLDYGLGKNSPLDKLYNLDIDSKILLLGVSYDSNTSFHLAEYKMPNVKKVKNGSPIIERGSRIWKEYKDIELNTDLFLNIGRDFEKEYQVHIGLVGSAETRVLSLKDSINFAEKWLLNYKNTNQ